MSEKKVTVPEGMLNSAAEACARELHYQGQSPQWEKECLEMFQKALEAALRWLQQNSESLMTQDVQNAFSIYRVENHTDSWLVEELMRRMFAAPDPDEPIKDLLHSDGVVKHWPVSGRHNDAVREGFRRGIEEGKRQCSTAE